MHLVDYFPQTYTPTLLVRLTAGWASAWAAFGVLFWVRVAADGGGDEPDAFLLLSVGFTAFAVFSYVLLAGIAVRAARLIASPRGRRTLAAGAIVAFFSHALVVSVASPIFFTPAALALAWRAIHG